MTCCLLTNASVTLLGDVMLIRCLCWV